MPKQHTAQTLTVAALAAVGTVALAAGVQTSARPKAGQKPSAGRAAAAVKSTSKAALPNTVPNASVKVGLSGVVRTWDLKAGDTVEIHAAVLKPSALPPNGRVAVEWSLQGDKGRWGDSRSELTDLDLESRRTDAFGIYQKPTANWRKVLHALDADVYMVYKAPATGRYTLALKPVTDEEPVGAGMRWREKGSVPALAALPSKTPWPSGLTSDVLVQVSPINLGTAAEQKAAHTFVETEPNDTPEQAQPLNLSAGPDLTTWEVTAGGDDVDYFDNGRVGRSGDDWYRINLTAAEPKLFTAQISMPGQFLVSRIRVYRVDKEAASGRLMKISEYREGSDPNERVHQQDEDHRANIARILKPGASYLLRVEANAPGYQLQLRTLRPGPYTDPREAIRTALYTHVGQVDSWLTNRPRGASVERRIRDTGNLLGTQCMSCHTQSGLWGPVVPLQNGYRVQNMQNFWHLQTVMYECLRPTNELKDAANNTSLAPLDIGDGPAGTRAAGFNIVNVERIQKPRRLHALQQVRTANFVLQTADPEGINAAGPGSNIGKVIVYLFSTEILKTAFESTGDPKYFHGIMEKAERTLAVKPQFTDDVALRLEYFGRVAPPARLEAWAAKAEASEKAAGRSPKYTTDAVKAFLEKVKVQAAEDDKRLRAIQNPDGSYSFNPGFSRDNGATWTQPDKGSDPAPTALAITGLTANGASKEDPVVAKAVSALLAMQEPQGRWNKAAQTGFVTTSYAMHALARLYPVTPAKPTRADFTAKPGESLPATIGRVQACALTGDPAFSDILLQAAKHPSRLVRYWAYIGLGATHPAEAVPVLLAGIRETAKPMRDAAAWALKMTLLDDKGWDAALNALEKGDDRTREQICAAVGLRADGVMPKAHINWTRLGNLLDRSMNADPHPGVRAWAAKSAWQLWVWNQPIRAAVNAAWVKMLERPEPNLLVENSNRYSSQALFIANGHKANGSKEHQYKELAQLFDQLTKRLEEIKDTALRHRLATRLVSIGGTFYATNGGDGGPGQMGYITPGSAEMMGAASLIYLNEVTKGHDIAAIKAGLEGAANVPNRQLTEFLVNYSLKGPEEVRQLAAGAVSDPRSVSLAAVPELVEPQLLQVKRGALEPPRRAQVSDPIIELWSKVNWVIPKTAEQQRNFFNIIIPKFEVFYTPAQIAAESDAGRRAEMEKEMNAAWYLADRLGEVLEKNPDLHHEIVFKEYFPESLHNPLQMHYWTRNVEWLLTFSGGELKQDRDGVKPVRFQTQKPPEIKADPMLIIKDRALQLYLDALKPEADPRTRAAAIRMCNKTALRSNPEVLRALSEAMKVEKDAELRKLIENVLKQGREKFLPELMALLKAEKHPSIALDSGGNPQLTKEQLDDILYFRDFVMPELFRQKRADQQSCIGCHGLPGRVPSLYLVAPDKFGYIETKDLITNYRILQQRVNFADLEKSKLLRKPLNVQDGTEDGHQGGRRYSPGDEGYQILRKWVFDQPVVLKTGSPARSNAAQSTTAFWIGVGPDSDTIVGALPETLRPRRKGTAAQR